MNAYAGGGLAALRVLCNENRNAIDNRVAAGAGCACQPIGDEA